MASESGLASLIPFQKSIQSEKRSCPPRPPNTELMWKNKAQMSKVDDDGSWEVRAFEEDTTGNVLGCTWPPRSYTCTFCRREFRSAQALGGHMNVHRRDRARLHEAPNIPPSPSAAQAPLSPLLIPTGQEFVANGLCLLYPLRNPNSILFPSTPPLDFSSPLLPISPFATNDTAANSVISSVCPSSNTEPSATNSNDNHRGSDENAKESAVEEELDLELRLGQRVPPPP